ncbi:MAG TPA: CDP-archaeol synthase [Acidobacteriota bacterium]|nr:CDP-archaeol synthase [Acidobacteriota bacterium]
MTRMISAVILGGIAIAAVLFSTPVYFLIGIGITGTICLYEYFRLTRSMGIKAQPIFGYAVFWILMIAFYQDRFPATIIMALVVLAAFLSAMWRHRLPIKERVFALMAELLGGISFSLFFFPAIAIRYDFGDQAGIHWFFIMFAVVWAGDSAALAVGKTLGRTRLAPLLSPKKTCEGAAAGLLAGILVAIILQRFLFTDLLLSHVVIASILLGVFGQLGDLAESMLKRAAQNKDSSRLIPGHGGLLDRMDSLLFAMPVLHFYLLIIY